jgi:hypothetical protein
MIPGVHAVTQALLGEYFWFMKELAMKASTIEAFESSKEALKLLKKLHVLIFYFWKFSGTLLTWGLTAAGAGMVVFLRGNQVNYKSI